MARSGGLTPGQGLGGQVRGPDPRPEPV